MGKKEGGLGWGVGGEGGGGAVNRRERGGRESAFDSKKKKVNSVPLFFVEHLALTLPCFLYSLLPPPQLMHTQTHRVQQICRISHQRAFSAQRCMLLNIYLHCIVCICPHCCNRQTLREERGK